MARRKGPQAKQAYSYIKSKILSYELPPGAAISDNALAQELNMSRSPVREAIFMLTNDGLIDSTGMGAQVSPMTLTDIVEICQVRKAVEVAAVNILLDNGGGTPEQKSRLAGIFKELQGTTDAIQNYLYQALMDNDREASVQSLTVHLDRSEQTFKKVLADPRYNPQFNLAMAHITNTYRQGGQT